MELLYMVEDVAQVYSQIWADDRSVKKHIKAVAKMIFITNQFN